MAIDPTNTTLYPIPSKRFDVAARNAEDLDQIVNGGATATVTNRSGGVMPSINKLLADSASALANTNIRGNYAAETLYSFGDIVKDASGDGTWYFVMEGYESVSIAADIAANKIKVWQVASIDDIDAMLGAKYATL